MFHSRREVRELGEIGVRPDVIQEPRVYVANRPHQSPFPERLIFLKIELIPLAYYCAFPLIRIAYTFAVLLFPFSHLPIRIILPGTSMGCAPALHRSELFVSTTRFLFLHLKLRDQTPSTWMRDGRFPESKNLSSYKFPFES
jgi:hypothetical protein